MFGLILPMINYFASGKNAKTMIMLAINEIFKEIFSVAFRKFENESNWLNVYFVSGALLMRPKFKNL